MQLHNGPKKKNKKKQSQNFWSAGAEKHGWLFLFSNLLLHRLLAYSAHLIVVAVIRFGGGATATTIFGLITVQTSALQVWKLRMCVYAVIIYTLQDAHEKNHKSNFANKINTVMEWSHFPAFIVTFLRLREKTRIKHVSFRGTKTRITCDQKQSKLKQKKKWRHLLTHEA